MQPHTALHQRSRHLPFASVSKPANTGEFRSLGEFLHCVRQASTGHAVDKRLSRAASSYGNEASGPDGGFAVPTGFAQQIAQIAYSEGSLLQLCSQLETGSNSIDIPKDETTPWGSGGVVAEWEGEGIQSTQRKPDLDATECRLRKLKVLVPATDELLADSPAMEGYLLRVMASAVNWKVNDAIINGTGAGQPLGILKADCLVVQTKETSQTADTITSANVANMMGRCLNVFGAHWLANPDALKQIIALAEWDGPTRTLAGLPVVPTEACQALGDEGDIILANMSGYQAVTRAGGAAIAHSMHLWFDQGMTAFRLMFRMDGQPLLSAPVTPPNSALTRSHFVALEARA